MDKKVLIIGIDGMDSELIERYQGSLPTISMLKKRGGEIRMRSIFPPDSTPAWASIYTGLNPAQHGVINFVNMADKENTYRPLTINDVTFKNKTFWDIASQHNKKVCVIFPLLIYPGWPVNGMMVCRTKKVFGKKSVLSAFPASVLERYKYNDKDINLTHGFISERQLPSFKSACLKRTEIEADLGLRAFRDEEWDLFFIYFSALDGIQHIFWNQQDVVKEFYVLMDNILGKFMGGINDNTSAIILSDHGHGMRPTKLVNINEVLRQKGLLKIRHGGGEKSHVSNQVKKYFFSFIKKYGVNPGLMKLNQKFSFWKKILAPSSIIDWGGTVAYASDLSVVKSYSYGGIRLNEKLVIKNKEAVISEIIELLKEIKDPNTGESIVKMAKKRDQLYEGEYIEKYPEIIVELDINYGMGWETGGAIFSEGNIHTIQPGSHKGDTPVLFISNLSHKKLFKDNTTLMDIYPVVLNILGIEADR